MKIVAVCGLGMGSSLILRMNIEDVLKKNNIKAVTEHTDVSSIEGNNPDIIVTSAELVKNLKETKAKVIVVKNFFDKDEIEKCFKDEKII